MRRGRPATCGTALLYQRTSTGRAAKKNLLADDSGRRTAQREFIGVGALIARDFKPDRQKE